MMKKLLSQWHYGLKTKVVDGALLVKFDTAVEPTLLRLDLSRVQANTLSIRALDGDYELGLGGYKMEFVPLARFEARDAAEAAQASIECALFKGTRTRRFRSALAGTIGVGLGIIVTLAILGSLFSATLGNQAATLMRTPSVPAGLAGIPGAGVDPAMLQAMQAMQGGAGLAAGLAPTAPVAPTEPGVPMSADDFLASTGAGQEQK